MQKLTLSQDEFFTHLPKLIASGVTFEAKECNVFGNIIITFTGGY